MYKSTKIKRDDKCKRNDRNNTCCSSRRRHNDRYYQQHRLYRDNWQRKAQVSEKREISKMRSRRNFASPMHLCSIFTMATVSLLFSPLAWIRNWAGIPRYELIPTYRRRSGDHIDTIQDPRDDLDSWRVFRKKGNVNLTRRHIPYLNFTL